MLTHHERVLAHAHRRVAQLRVEVGGPRLHQVRETEGDVAESDDDVRTERFVAACSEDREEKLRRIGVPLYSTQCLLVALAPWLQWGCPNAKYTDAREDRAACRHTPNRPARPRV